MEYSILNIKELTNENILEVEKRFPKKYKQIQKMVYKKQQKASIAAYFLLSKAFPEIKEEDIFIDQFGKPYLKDNRYFNISHSEDLAILAVSDYEVGVDIEKMDFSKYIVSNKLFSKDELHYINNNGSKGFYVIWTLKEAYLKCLGTGLVIPLNSVDVAPFIDQEFVINKNEKFYVHTTSTKEYVYSIIEKTQLS